MSLNSLKGPLTVETPSTPASPVSVVEEEGKAIRWVVLFPEDQSGAHIRPFDGVKHLPGVFRTYYYKGEIIAHVTTLNESGLDEGIVRGLFSDWKKYLEVLSYIREVKAR
jgi:hypothetical protein